MRRSLAACAVATACLILPARADKAGLDETVAFFGDLYAVAALCPKLKIDERALAQGPMMPGFDRSQWQLLIEEGRRRSPEFIRKLSPAPETIICDYGWKSFGPGNGGYLVER